MQLFDWNTLGMLTCMFIAFSALLMAIVEGVKRTMADKDGNTPRWFRVGVRFLIPAFLGATIGAGVLPIMLLAVGFTEAQLSNHTAEVAFLGAFLGAGAGAVANGVYQFADSFPWSFTVKRVVERFTK